MGRRVKIGWFVHDPAQKRGKHPPLSEQCQVCPDPRQLGIAERRMDRAMADRVERDGAAPAFALRGRMMPFDATAEGARA